MNRVVLLAAVFFTLTCFPTGCHKADPPISSASAPNPADDATGISPDTYLNWTGPEDVTYKVYFGTESPPPLATEQQTTSFNPGPLEFDTTYYWKIDIVGQPQGRIWKFTTFWYGDPAAEEMDI